MLNTLRATLFPSGVVSFDEPLQITGATRVLVTLLDEHPLAGTPDPPERHVNDQEREVWEDLLNFSAWQPARMASLKDEM